MRCRVATTGIPKRKELQSTIAACLNYRLWCLWTPTFSFQSSTSTLICFIGAQKNQQLYKETPGMCSLQLPPLSLLFPDLNFHRSGLQRIWRRAGLGKDDIRRWIGCRWERNGLFIACGHFQVYVDKRMKVSDYFMKFFKSSK